MGDAVAPVQSHLRAKGYFTVSEYPAVEAGAPARTDLDLDLGGRGARGGEP